MKMFYSAVSMLVLVAVTVASPVSERDPKLCCFPKQFTSSIGQVNGLILSSGQGLVQYNNINAAFDFTNNRVSEDISSFTSGTSTMIKVIIDFKQNIMYTILGQTCTKSEAKGQFLQCIPKTAKFYDTFTIGDKQLDVDSYTYYAKAPEVVEGNVSLSVTHVGCIPTSTLITGKTLAGQSLPIMSTSGYFNYTKGIRNPGYWFTIPDICKMDSPIKRSADPSPIVQLVNQISALILPMA